MAKSSFSKATASSSHGIVSKLQGSFSILLKWLIEREPVEGEFIALLSSSSAESVDWLLSPEWGDGYSHSLHVISKAQYQMSAHYE